MDEDPRPVGECDFCGRRHRLQDGACRFCYEKYIERNLNEEELPTHRTGGSA